MPRYRHRMVLPAVFLGYMMRTFLNKGNGQMKAYLNLMKDILRMESSKKIEPMLVR